MRALRAVLAMVLVGTVFVQAGMVWALAGGNDPEDGSLPLDPLRVITVLGMVSVQVALVCVWRLVTMVRRGTVFSHAAFRYVDVVIGAIVAAALLWFAVTALNPKSIAFFVAFVPQFIDYTAPLLPQFIIMEATFVVLATANALAYALAADQLRLRVRRPGVLKWMNRAGAGCLVGMGIATAAISRS